MDIIYLHDLKVETIIGVFAWERRMRQTVHIDLDMEVDVRVAAASDAIADALDYKAVAKAVSAAVGTSVFHLVESLAQRVADVVLEGFPVARVRVRVGKPGAIRNARDVGVVIERERRA